ncbi:DsbA family protein [Candidatus Woesearchaeota archaeon]|nr:MAG: DsbA family protein [Candidatus Woesearchaeota archaeon]
MRKEDNVTLSKASIWKGVSAVLAVLLIISIYTGGFGRGSNKAEDVKSAKQAQPPPAAQPEQPAPKQQVVDMESLMDDDPVKGDKNAPVTIVEWSDFQCPFCGRFYSQTLGKIYKEYIQTGKVKLVYRDFPLSFHQNAQKAAEAAECADEQGKFWEMHDMLFEKGVDGGVPTFKSYAADLGLDSEKFDSCLDSGKMAAEVQKDMRDGAAAGITGTPGFVVNGKIVKGAQPFEAFKAIIDAELSN